MKKLLILLLLLAAPAQAQQQKSPADVAIEQKLMEEIGQNLQLRARVIELQAQLDKLKAEAEAKRK